jgi:DNA (cytosine-5)-methyltransferase 1
MNKQLTIVSLFAGAGGLDLGFEQAGFRTIWANEFDRQIWATFERNFPNVKLDKRSITDIEPSEIPYADGIIGGPPCQSWSNAGAKRGLDDSRGQMFLHYINTIRIKQPKFFLCENVAGMVSKRNVETFNGFIKMFKDAGYNVSWKLLDASDYGVPQTRRRVIIVGYRKDLGKQFTFPTPLDMHVSQKDALADLPPAVIACDGNHANTDLAIPDHEYYQGSFSSRYLMANRRRAWDKPSYTIVATAHSNPLHPSCPPMLMRKRMDFVFEAGRENEYRRLSVRECARVQTFPDDFIFVYKGVSVGYKMVGNAVPVKLAEVIAKQIYQDLG